MTNLFDILFEEKCFFTFWGGLSSLGMYFPLSNKLRKHSFASNGSIWGMPS